MPHTTGRGALLIPKVLPKGLCRPSRLPHGPNRGLQCLRLVYPIPPKPTSKKYVFVLKENNGPRKPTGQGLYNVTTNLHTRTELHILVMAYAQ